MAFNICREVAEFMREQEGQGATCILLAAALSIVGAFAVKDPLKPEAIGVVSALRRWGISFLVIFNRGVGDFSSDPVTLLVLQPSCLVMLRYWKQPTMSWIHLNLCGICAAWACSATWSQGTIGRLRAL